MQDLATSAAIAPAAPIGEKRGRKRGPTKRMRQVIDLIESGECKTKKIAAERVGLHPDYVRRELKKPHIRVFCEQRARENLTAGLLRASMRAVELIDGESEHVAFDASKHVLAIHGIKPAQDAQLSVNIDIKAGYVIDLSGRRDQALSQPDNHNPEISTTYKEVGK